MYVLELRNIRNKRIDTVKIPSKHGFSLGIRNIIFKHKLQEYVSDMGPDDEGTICITLTHPTKEKEVPALFGGTRKDLDHYDIMANKYIENWEDRVLRGVCLGGHWNDDISFRLAKTSETRYWINLFKAQGLTYPELLWTHRKKLYVSTNRSDTNFYTSKGEIIFNPITMGGGGDAA